MTKRIFKFRVVMLTQCNLQAKKRFAVMVSTQYYQSPSLSFVKWKKMFSIVTFLRQNPRCNLHISPYQWLNALIHKNITPLMHLNSPLNIFEHLHLVNINYT